MDARPKESIAAVQHVFALLEALAEAKWASTVELTVSAGLAPTATQRLLETLAALGHVREEEGAWRLATPLFELGARALQTPDLLDIAKPVMRDLADASGEAVQLGLLTEEEIICLHKVESRHAAGISMSVGHPVAMQGSAMGKALMAWSTAWEPPASRAELARIRAQGFCELRGLHVHSVAAVIFDHRSTPIAGLAVHAPNTRINEDAAHILAARVRNAAGAISQGLGCAETPLRQSDNPIQLDKLMRELSAIVQP